MYTLLLNASDGLLQCAIAKGTQLLYICERYIPKMGTEHFAPMLEESLQNLNCTAKTITRVLCINGPGSFTGVRLSTMTAIAFCLPHNTPYAFCSSLQALAYSIPPSILTCPLLVLLKAQKNLLYTQWFSCNGEPTTSITCSTPEEVLRTLLKTEFRIIGNGIALMPSYSHMCIQHPNVPVLHVLSTYLDTFIYTTDLERAITLYARTVEAEHNVFTIAKQLGFSQQHIETVLSSTTLIEKE